MVAFAPAAPKRMDRVPLGILFMLGAPLYR
jgi:hypothetical protein